MELDTFCDSIYTWISDVGSGTYENFIKTMKADEFIPRTDNAEFNKYFILFGVWNDITRDYDRIFIMCKRFDEGQYEMLYPLNDITELYATLNMNKSEDYVFLRNYCCRRLREELNNAFPEHFKRKTKSACNYFLQSNS